MEQLMDHQYEEQLREKIMFMLASGQTVSLKNIADEMIEEHNEHSQYIRTAYYKVKSELVG